MEPRDSQGTGVPNVPKEVTSRRCHTTAWEIAGQQAAREAAGARADARVAGREQLGHAGETRRSSRLLRERGERRCTYFGGSAADPSLHCENQSATQFAGISFGGCTQCIGNAGAGFGIICFLTTSARDACLSQVNSPRCIVTHVGSACVRRAGSGTCTGSLARLLHGTGRVCLANGVGVPPDLALKLGTE